jgi:AcrR family transcriptional regulator
VNARLRGAWLVGGAVAVSVALAAAYLAAGGASYEPTAVADPCQPREWRSPDGVEEAAEQFALSALDGAACELQVGRETLAVALATEESRQEFAAAYGVDDAELEAAVQAGLARAVDDAERAGALSPLVASGLRAVVTNLPIDEAIALINDADQLFEGGGGLLDRLGDVVP